MTRTRQAKYDCSASGMRTVSCRLRAKDYKAFRNVCEAQGFTMHNGLREMIACYMDSMGELPYGTSLRDALNRASSITIRFRDAKPPEDALAPMSTRVSP